MQLAHLQHLVSLAPSAVVASMCVCRRDAADPRRKMSCKAGRARRVMCRFVRKIFMTVENTCSVGPKERKNTPFFLSAECMITQPICPVAGGGSLPSVKSIVTNTADRGESTLFSQKFFGGGIDGGSIPKILPTGIPPPTEQKTREGLFWGKKNVGV